MLGSVGGLLSAQRFEVAALVDRIPHLMPMARSFSL